MNVFKLESYFGVASLALADYEGALVLYTWPEDSPCSFYYM